MNISKNNLAKLSRQRPCIFFVFLCLFNFSNTSFCQSISTVSEIYNYNINDIFHIREYGSSPGHGFSTHSNIQITNKYYSANNDTLFYSRSVITVTSSSDHPQWVYDSFTDTIFYTGLDSLINAGNIDSVFYDTLYNGRKINYADYVFSILSNSNLFVDGCGGPYYEYWNYETNVLHYLELKYFLKGTEEWGVPYYVSMNDFSLPYQYFLLYPNPAHDHITINSSDSNFSNNSINGSISSIDGRTIKKFSFSSDNKSYSIDLSGIGNGIYFVRLETDKNVFVYKFLKE